MLCAYIGVIHKGPVITDSSSSATEYEALLIKRALNFLYFCIWVVFPSLSWETVLMVKIYTVKLKISFTRCSPHLTKTSHTYPNKNY